MVGRGAEINGLASAGWAFGTVALKGRAPKDALPGTALNCCDHDGELDSTGQFMYNPRLLAGAWGMQDLARCASLRPLTFAPPTQQRQSRSLSKTFRIVDQLTEDVRG